MWLRSLSVQRLLLPLVLVIVFFMEAFGLFVPAGRWLYGHTIHTVYNHIWNSQAVTKGIYDSNPVLIAIDEASLAAFGRWPWSRKIHAELLNTLTNSPKPPTVLAWDIVFSEPQVIGVVSQDSDEDGQFAHAINAANYPIILATQFDFQGDMMQFIVPHEPLSNSRAKIAHVHLEADNDGLIRKYQSNNNTFTPFVLPYLGNALLFPETTPNITQIKSTNNITPSSFKQINEEWLYPMPTDWVHVVSYQAILSGNVPAHTWANTQILVAATAQGLGDQYVSHIYSPSSILAGGELVLAALHTEKLLQAGFPKLHVVSQTVNAIWLIFLTGLMFLGLRRTTYFKTQIFFVISGLLVTAGVSFYSLAIYGAWLNPWASWFAISLLWILWMSHKLQRLLTHLISRLHAIQTLNPLHSFSSVLSSPQNTAHHIPLILSGRGRSTEDAIDEQINTINDLEARSLAEFKRLNEVLELMPDATFVFNQKSDNNTSKKDSTSTTNNTQLRLNQYNQAARRLAQNHQNLHAILDMPNHLNSTGFNLNTLLLDFIPDFTPAQNTVLLALEAALYADNFKTTTQSTQLFTWEFLLTTQPNSAFSQGVEAITTKGTRYLIKLAQLFSHSTHNNNTQHTSNQSNTNHTISSPLLPTECSWILSIVDLSVSLALGQNRERTLSFLSHDLRAPQVSILALIDFQKNKYPEQADFYKKIQFQAQRTLSLAEGFVQWSQASHGAAYQFIEYNLNELMVEAVDELWANAQQKNVRLIGNQAVEENPNSLENLDKSEDNSENNSEEFIESGLWVRLDRNLMWRAVVNLINNALNVSAAGTTIHLSTRKVGRYAILAVQDEGPGIPSELQNRLFEPFAQGAGLKRTGAGLGLAFVKTVCDQHHGQVRLISPIYLTPQPHGTCFELHIPLIENDTTTTENSENI